MVLPESDPIAYTPGETILRDLALRLELGNRATVEFALEADEPASVIALRASEARRILRSEATA